MLKYIQDKLRTAWYNLSSVPRGFFSGYPSRSEYNFVRRDYAIMSAEQALTLSPFWAALRLYQNSLAVLPLVTYRTDADGGRHRLQDQSTFSLLHDRPNPAMSRAAFFEFLIKEYFLEGEFFVQIQWANNNRLLGLFPVRARDVLKIECDDKWNKVYTVSGLDEPLLDSEMLHCIHFSHCGFRGTPFVRFAAEALGLHKQVQESATAYYGNSARPSGYLKYPGKVTKEAGQNIKDNFAQDYQGTGNTGRIPIIGDNGEFQPFSSTGAADAQIIEAIGTSVDDIARWFDNLSPLILGNLSRGTYSNSAADKLAFHQKNLLPVLEKIQLEINHKLFGSGSQTYCEFLTDNILRADPLTQSTVWHNGIQDGYILRSEVRAWLNLPPVEGLDQPMQPMNMATPETPAVGEEDNGADQNMPEPTDTQG